MPKDILDIVDTAVKIGLGALISGSATYWVTKLNHNKAAEKEKLEKRRQMVEEVAENIERLFALLFRFRAGVHDWVNAKDNGKKLTDERYEHILSEQRDIPKSYKEITSSEAKLLLLGEKTAQSYLSHFGHEISEIRNTVILGNNSLTSNEVENFRANT